jgi:hypothetical protein
MAHDCNPSCSGSRDQEDSGSKSVQANSSWDPISRNPSQKRAGGVAQGVGPEFKSQYHKKKKSTGCDYNAFIDPWQTTLIQNKPRSLGKEGN